MALRRWRCGAIGADSGDSNPLRQAAPDGFWTAQFFVVQRFFAPAAV